MVIRLQTPLFFGEDVVTLLDEDVFPSTAFEELPRRLLDSVYIEAGQEWVSLLRPLTTHVINTLDSSILDKDTMVTAVDKLIQSNFG